MLLTLLSDRPPRQSLAGGTSSNAVVRLRSEEAMYRLRVGANRLTYSQPPI